MLAYMDDMRYGVVLDPNEQLITVLNYLGESASQISTRLQLQVKHRNSTSAPQPQQLQQLQQVPSTPTKTNDSAEITTPQPTQRSSDPREAVSKALWRISAPPGPPPSSIAAKRRSVFSSDDVSKLAVDGGDDSLASTIADSKLSTPVGGNSNGNGHSTAAEYSEEDLSQPVAHTFKRNNISASSHMVPTSPRSPTFSRQPAPNESTSIILSDEDWLVILHGWDTRIEFLHHHHPNDIAYVNDKTGEPAYFHAPEEPQLLRDWDQFAELSRTIGGHLDSLGADLDGMAAELARRCP